MSGKTWLGKKAFDLAFRYEQSKGHCAQCTLAAIMEVVGMVDEKLLQAADGLTGGTAMSTEGTCGALAAGILAISAFTGRTYPNFVSVSPGHSWEYVSELQTKFEREYGGITGRKVQESVFGRSHDLRNQQERLLFEKAGAHIDKCPMVCGNVAKWTVEIINRLES